MDRVRKVLSKWSTALAVQCLGVFDMERGKDTKVCVSAMGRVMGIRHMDMAHTAPKPSFQPTTPLPCMCASRHGMAWQQC